MKNLGMMNLSGLPSSEQAKILISFLYQLTIGVRDIHFTEKPNFKRQLYGINQIYHMVFPLLEFLLYEKYTSYTTDIVMQNIVDMVDPYDVKEQVTTAWDHARSYAL